MSLTLAQALAAFEPGLPLGVAYSGGADSTALLWACARKWPGQVVALHVHHGLQAAADQFEQHCQKFCSELQLPLHVAHVDARAANGQSPEDAARQARYQALAGLAREAGLREVALAQHADDQVETVMLALGRGSGLPGLSAMPSRWQRDGLLYHRPLLAVPGQELRDALRVQAIDWVEDPSNRDLRFTRNRIRSRLLPALEDVFPQFRDTMARSASHAAQAQRLLQEMAAEDLARTGCPPSLRGLQALSRARQANLLRYWLRALPGATPSDAQLQELLDQIAACTTRGHGLRIKVGSGLIARSGDQLDWYNHAV